MKYASILGVLAQLDIDLTVAQQIVDEECGAEPDIEKKAIIKNVVAILKETHISFLGIREPLGKLLGDDLPQVYKLC